MRALLFTVCLLASAVQAAPLNPNLADPDALASVPGLTSTLVQRIVDARPILTPAELDDVLSTELDVEQRAAVYKDLFRPLNLNTASEREIRMIPGVSAKLAHEFEEYRPYRSMQQFRREIGKYVDDAEVDRLAGYVFVPVALNSADEAAVMSIPGMTKKMAHEFEEYRPYSSLEQFRREIGKYVDDAEVRRLESYVVLD